MALKLKNKNKANAKKEGAASIPEGSENTSGV